MGEAGRGGDGVQEGGGGMGCRKGRGWGAVTGGGRGCAGAGEKVRGGLTDPGADRPAGAAHAAALRSPSTVPGPRRFSQRPPVNSRLQRNA